jgi:uncharacterized membrane protein
MKRYLEFLLVLFFTIFTLVTLFLDMTWVGGVISLIGFFIVPGWLLTHALLGDSNKPDLVSRFILVFALGATLVAFEMLGLTLLKVKISRESAILVGTIISWLLLGLILIIRRQTTSSDSGNSLQVSTLSLLIPIMAVIVIIAIVPLHQPIVQERFTEFYTLPRISEPVYTEVVIVNHEQKRQTYTVACKDGSNPESLLLIATLESESSQSFNLNLAQPAVAHKLRLNLYLEEVTVPYRWLEVMGTRCDALLSGR